LNWSHILDQAGNIAIGLVLLFVGVPIVVLVLTFLGKLVVNIISWPLGLAVFALLNVYRWLVFKLFGKQVLQSIFSQDKIQAEPSVLTNIDRDVLVKSVQDVKPTILDLNFIDDESTPFGFTVVPKDTSTYKKTEVCKHMDSPYVRMTIWVQGRYINFLFDKNKNHISWEQRTKEVENFSPEEKLFGVGYKVIRTRCVIPISESNGGTEYCGDILYYQETQIASSKSDLVPIQKIYEKHLEDVQNSSLQKKSLFAQKRIKNKELYLDIKTPHADRMAILYEEVGCEVATLGYHFMARDNEALFNLRNYTEYCSGYFSKIENSEENYIDYLRAYFYGLREAALEDNEGDEELELIKHICKEANLLHVFKQHYSKNHPVFVPTTDMSELVPNVEKATFMPPEIESGSVFTEAGFDGLVGRRLLRVYGLRNAGTTCQFENEADIIWLALEGDSPEQIIWMSPQWSYRGPNFGFDMGVVQSRVLAIWQLPTFIVDESLYAPPVWQMFAGLFLCDIQARSAYDQHTSAPPLTLHFARVFRPSVATSEVPTGTLSFDSPDLDEPYVMDIADVGDIGHWCLRRDVQLSLVKKEADKFTANAATDAVAAPWNDKNHLNDLLVLYATLQEFALWWQTQTNWAIEGRKRQGPMPELWRALNALARFQIALIEGNQFQTEHGGWLDSDGDDYDEAWVRLRHKHEYSDLAQNVHEHVVNWMRWMAWDEWQALVGGDTVAFEEATRIKWQGVSQSYMNWYRRFAQCGEEAKMLW
jgi:hypothetical protein